MKKFNEHTCISCGNGIDDKIYDYSVQRYQYELCLDCQEWLKRKEEYVSIHSKKFYLALRARGVPVKKEQFDGYKHIDLAIPQYFLNIEIDGTQHYTDVQQSYRDLERTYHSMLKGFKTIRLPNILIEEKSEEVADMIVDLLTHLRTKKKNFTQPKTNTQ